MHYYVYALLTSITIKGDVLYMYVNVNEKFI